jgi:hypothetical protein
MGFVDDSLDGERHVVNVKVGCLPSPTHEITNRTEYIPSDIQAEWSCRSKGREKTDLALSLQYTSFVLTVDERMEERVNRIELLRAIKVGDKVELAISTLDLRDGRHELKVCFQDVKTVK